jgi:hypothetical protein
MSQNFKITPDDASVLEEEFGDRAGNIGYPRFLAAILPQGPPAGPDIADIVAPLRRFLSDRRITICPLLEQYRPLTVDDLLAVLRKLLFDLNQQDPAVLRTSFRGRNVDIAELCGPADYRRLKWEEKEEGEDPTPAEREVPPDRILGVLAKITAVERRTNFDFLAEFRERDSFKHGQMPVSQFHTILLASKVDYPSLIVDKEKLNNGNAAGDGVQTADEILTQFQIALQERKIAPNDLFVKYDRFGNGTILAVRAPSIFDAVAVKPTETEDKNLREAFRDPQSVDMFDYGKLCALIAPPEGKQGHHRELLFLLNSLRERIQARRPRPRRGYR